MKNFNGKILFLDRADINTDEIIPAKYLTESTKVALKPYCLEDLVLDGFDSKRDIAGKQVIITRSNFGCGSSREHAPVALGAAGCKAVVAEYYARIFFRNSVATGEVYPFETATPLVAEFKTGDEAELDTDAHTLTRLSDGKVFPLKDLGAVAPVVEAGGMFAYARKEGMIPSAK